METRSPHRFRVLRGATLALLGAGSVLTPTCTSRFRDAIFEGTQDFAFSLLNPTPLVDALTVGSGASTGP